MAITTETPYIQHSSQEAVDSYNDFRIKNRTKFLILLILSQIGQQYNFQTTETLQVPLQEKLGLDEIGFGKILIFQSIPGLFLPIIGGYLTDMFGASYSVATAVALSLTGQLITTISALEENFTVFVIGKVVSLASFEATILSRTKLLRAWFTDADLGRANSINIVSQTSAIILCDLTYPQIYQATQNLAAPFIVGSVVCFISLLFCIFMLLLHKQLVKRDPHLNSEEGNKHVSFMAIKRFPSILWHVSLTVTIGIVGYIITKIYVSKHLKMKYNFDIGQAGFFLAFSQVVSLIATPFAGLFIDKIGRIPIMLTAASFCASLGSLLLMVLPSCDKCLLPAIPIAILSLSSAPIFISAYASLSRIIPVKDLGLATATIPVLLSLQIGIFSTVGSRIAQDTIKDHGYTYVFLMASLISFVSLLLALKTQWLDVRGDKILQNKRKSEQILPSFLEASDGSPRLLH